MDTRGLGRPDVGGGRPFGSSYTRDDASWYAGDRVGASD